MMKHEFENLIEDDISHTDYTIIETVYTYHPAFDLEHPKQAAATVYLTLGMAPFRAMLETADTLSSMESRLNALKKDVADLTRQIADFKECTK